MISRNSSLSSRTAVARWHRAPLPPGIFGYRDGERGVNPITHEWLNGVARQRGIEFHAAVAGKGRLCRGVIRSRWSADSCTTIPRRPADNRRHCSGIAQLAKLGIELVIRATGLQSLSGQDAYRYGADFQLGLERRLPGPGEFLLSTVRPATARCRIKGRMLRISTTTELTRQDDERPAQRHGAQVIDRMVGSCARNHPGCSASSPSIVQPSFMPGTRTPNHT